ncbi:DNA cytosine methyltransferase [Cereibacter azotoformans]|uniref:DNA cytosine methyltransferase n=1 Tax=Cereibacter azotoformans TaxID=43057 RepID=UPI000E35A4F7|nr:DNA cytosine methyltransferase [Cereibacter azotoformans]AXQ93168.1 DNA methyltransferase [Cereibacter sphaeroides]UIJ31477.1 DNA cytosine methyltransferase [Cereibacter azotoformans]
MADGAFFDTRPMIVDSFAGGGGASTGIELALGRAPDVAINHSASALALHAANHPETLHLDSNIWDVEPRTVVGSRRVGLLWASPDCKHFSKAKGGAPRDRNIRDLAWVVVRWAEEVQPDVILMENVEEFVTWGPVGEDGQPIKEFAGMTFEAWVKRLKRAGYKVQWRELRACDYGAPTIRKRWFLVARRDGRPITWPKPTHGDPKSEAVRKGKLPPWRTAAECIDWSIPCPSIFATSAEIMEQHGLRAVRPLAANTLARIARGMRRYVLDAERPFLVNLTHGGREEDLAQPFRTITGAHRGEKALVAPSLTRFNGGATGSDLREPAPTVTANSWIKKPGGAAPLGLLASSLASLKGTDRRDSPVTAPHPTVLVGGGHSALIAPALATFYGHGDGRGVRAAGLAEPLRTVTTENRHALVAPVLTYAQQGGGNRSAEDPHHTICASAKDQNSLIAASLVQTGYGERQGQAPRALDIGAPLGTVVAGGAKHAPIAAFLAQQNTGLIGHDMREPLSTIVGKGCTQTPVAAWFAKYYGTGDGARTDEPAHTITVKDRLGHMQAALVAPPFGPEHEARARHVAEFLRAHGAWSGGEFVTLDLDGATFVIVDIGMRMLTPRELFRAQGFPTDYVIEGVWEERDGDMRWRPFPKDVQVSCCGNSVCPPLAEALVRANCSHLAAEAEEAVA